MTDLTDLPITTMGYSFAAPVNQIYSTDVDGGMPVITKCYKYAPVVFNVSLVGTSTLKSAFKTFYKTTTFNGTKKFTMFLDSGYGIEEHTVQIIPNTLDMSLVKDPDIQITFQVMAERTPAQDDPYGGGLWDLYDAYSDEDIEELFSQLEIFVLEDLPFYWG